jgi:hypothetical protein
MDFTTYIRGRRRGQKQEPAGVFDVIFGCGIRVYL